MRSGGPIQLQGVSAIATTPSTPPPRSGGEGADLLRGGGGQDQLLPDGRLPDNDVEDGGAGIDVVTYAYARDRLVDLRGELPSGARERETLTAVEVLFARRG